MSATLRLILEDGKMVQTLKEIPTYDTGQFYEARDVTAQRLCPR